MAKRIETDEVAARARELAASYLRGERTDEEVFRTALADPALEDTARACLRVHSVAQEMLEKTGQGPFDIEVTFAAPPRPGRTGLVRNLELARDGKLDAVALADWATDALTWPVVGAPEDDLVAELLVDLAMDEDRAAAITADRDAVDALISHLRDD